MIKLKSIMRDAGIISEQEQAAKTITVTSQTTRDQLAQQTANIPVGTEVTINFNVESIIPDNEILSSQQANKVAEQIKMINEFIDSGEILVIAHASDKPATMKKADQNGKVEQPAVLKLLFPNFNYKDYTNLTFTPLNADMFDEKGNSTPQTRGKGNTNLAINRAASIGSTITVAGIDLSKFKVEYDIRINQPTAWVGIQMTGTYIRKRETGVLLHRIALGFSNSGISFFCMENLKNYEDLPVNELLGYVNKNIETLSSAEGNELQYLDSYQWMRDNLTGSMRDSYSTAIYGSVISPKSPRSKSLVDLLKKYGATQSTINPKTKIRLEDTTAKHAWFIYDERQIVNFFRQVSKDELKKIKVQTTK